MISILNLLFDVVLLLSMPINKSVAAFPIAKLGCTPSCGNVSIPFPFGIEEDCYLEDDFAIDCNSDKPFLGNLNLEVLDISLDGTRELIIKYFTLAIRSEAINQMLN
ncbi:hypothetical protein Patl1_37666 [Pistacia atlantica]|nr:hypothetical protein Patl1_37666 [Pistacia atlantica]